MPSALIPNRCEWPGFLAERHKEVAIVIASHMALSQCFQTFKNPMTAMAAIGRLAYHATILEFTGEGVRTNAAKKVMRLACLSDCRPTA